MPSPVSKTYKLSHQLQKFLHIAVTTYSPLFQKVPSMSSQSSNFSCWANFVHHHVTSEGDDRRRMKQGKGRKKNPSLSDSKQQIN